MAVQPPGQDQDQEFVRFSAALTGFSEFDLRGTGAAGDQLRALRRGAGEATTTALLDLFTLLTEKHPDDLDRAIRDEILSDPLFGPVARTVAKAWYTGTWFPLPRDWVQAHGAAGAPPAPYVISETAYTESLVWAAARTHPPGARAPGFGSWAEPPAEVTP